MGRIFLFGTAVVIVLLLTLIYATMSGQVARLAVASPTPSAAGAVPSTPASITPIPPTSAAPSTPANVTPTPASGVPGPSGSATAVLITISGASFGADRTIATGTTVTFTNKDPIKHTATNGTDGKPATGSLFDLQLDAGASGSYTFAKPGTYRVTCTIHPTINLAITVQ